MSLDLVIPPVIIRDGTYRIRSSFNTSIALDLQPDFVRAVPSDKSSITQKWSIASDIDGTFRICNLSRHFVLGISGSRIAGLGSGSSYTWTMEPRGNAFIIGNPTDETALYLTETKEVRLCVRNNQIRQRWCLELIELSKSNSTARISAQTHAWTVKPNLSLIDDLPQGTQLMGVGPSGAWVPGTADYEAFQVARWALRYFDQSAIPMTHPGNRGIWDALPLSIRSGTATWTQAYVFQRLIEIAALSPAGHAIPVVDPEDKLADAPAATLAAVAGWTEDNKLLFSYCFRLHRALSGRANMGI